MISYPWAWVGRRAGIVRVSCYPVCFSSIQCLDMLILVVFAAQSCTPMAILGSFIVRGPWLVVCRKGVQFTRNIVCRNKANSVFLGRPV